MHTNIYTHDLQIVVQQVWYAARVPGHHLQRHPRVGVADQDAPVPTADHQHMSTTVVADGSHTLDWTHVWSIHLRIGLLLGLHIQVYSYTPTHMQSHSCSSPVHTYIPRHTIPDIGVVLVHGAPVVVVPRHHRRVRDLPHLQEAHDLRQHLCEPVQLLHLHLQPMRPLLVLAHVGGWSIVIFICIYMCVMQYMMYSVVQILQTIDILLITNDPPPIIITPYLLSWRFG